MKRIFITTFFIFITLIGMAQPEPFPIDRSFVPELDFLQKQWFGEYNGVDPMSQARLSISRTLSLYEDMTFTNVSCGIISTNGGVSDEIKLRSERGTYKYDSTTKGITYVLEADTALDMNAYMRNKTIEYKVNEYSVGSKDNMYSEPAQFTYPNEGVRKWVVQDPKLGSDQQQGKPAVYVMTGTDLSTSAISDITVENASTDIYDLKGNKLKYVQSKTIIIKSGKKYLTK